eukprot:CAMPEP_0113904228 /NCGR_PEP_ID=MMETSP0780_2-20120614/23079_1 /TAXON_ID=652834 /ORGANISM="Palpitomonas bilix" /LENGTH=56 /DNA_ID=CAMNT_0000897701 /DNA_START=570 /DNA_END=737 /DNA_ORIENTATION=+ /assembly_acc=CAM_ASM_000599
MQWAHDCRALIDIACLALWCAALSLSWAGTFIALARVDAAGKGKKGWNGKAKSGIC